MKRTVFIFIFLFLSLYSLKAEIILTKQEQNFIKNAKVKVVVGTPWEPFGIKKGEEYRGLSYDFFNLIKQKTGLKSQDVKVKSFSAVLDSIKRKTADITLSVGATKDRREYALFSKSYARFPISIATSKEVQAINDINLLKDKKIAVGRNFTAHKMMKEMYPNFEYVLVKDVTEGLRFLSQGKVFAFIDIMPVLAYNINKLGYTNLKISGSTGIDFDLVFMIRDDYPELLSISNKVIDSLSEDEKQAILNKWVAVVYDENFDYEILIELSILFFIVILIIVYKNRQLIKYQEIINDKTKTLEKQKDELLQTNTLLKNTQNELNSSLKSFKTLVDSTIEGIIIIENKKVIYCNEAFLEIFGYEHKADIKYTSINRYFVDDIMALGFENSAQEFFGKRKDGIKFPILIKKVYLEYEAKSRLVISIFDLSELKSKERLLLEQSKMASMGEMIGNIAHQWRQPLSTITTAASGLKLQREFNTFDEEFLDEALDIILKNGKFLSQTIDDFRNYLKDSKTKEKFDLTKLVQQSLSIVRPTFKNNYIIDVMEINNPVYINSYFNELNQALINILNNAKDALKEKEQEDRYVFINFFVQKEEVVIEIYDNAGGIKEDIIKNIFEPYFTTKHKSQGTGLGLYMTYKIITESLNGSISAENILFRYKNRDYKGANFIIRLPLS